MIKITIRKTLRIIPKTEEDLNILRYIANAALDKIMSSHPADERIQNILMSAPVEWIKIKRVCEEIRGFKK